MEEGKKKEGFFRRLGKDLRLQVGFCVVSVMVLFIIYFPLAAMLEQGNRKEDAQESVVVASDTTFAGISEIEEKQQKLSISGWGIRLDSTLQDIYVVLQAENMEDEKSIVLDTKSQLNGEVQEYMEYLQVENTVGCGFGASVKADKLQKGVCYKIQVYMNYTQEEKDGAVKIATNQYLYNGKLYDYNPLEFVAPVFSDEQMKQVVEQGKLMGYTMEHGAWVYLYEGSLYWVLDKSITHNVNENLHIFLHLMCTNKEDLPESRRSHGFDNKDYVFKTKELVVADSDSYRVATMPMDMDYAITYIRTGEYNTEMQKNTWNARFCLSLGIEE